MFNRDPFARRLSRLGCVLMVLPMVMAAIGVAYFGWPLMLSLLPRSIQPVLEAQPNETLMVITTLPDNRELQRDIDRAILQEFEVTNLGGISLGLYRARTGVLTRTIADEDEAQALTQEYGARFVVWGTPDEIRVTISRRFSDAEPRLWALPIEPDTDPLVVGQMLVAVMNIYNGDPASAIPLLFAAEGYEMGAFYLALAQQENGAPSEALSHVEDGLEDYPESGPLIMLRALLLLDEGRFAEALDSLDAALAQDPANVEMLLQRARVHRLTTNYEQAAADLAAALAAESENVEVLLERYVLELETRDRIAAIETLDEVIALQPEVRDHYINRGVLNAEVGRTDAALDDFERALELADGDQAQAFVYQARAEAYVELDNIEAAIEDYNRVLEILPESQPAVMALGALYWSEGEEQRAINLYSNRLFPLQSSSNDAIRYNNAAWELALAGYYDPALYYSNLSLSIDPVNANSLHTHGYVNLGLGNYAEAVGDFEDAINNGLTYNPVYRDLGDAFFGLEQWEDAIFYYQIFLDLMPTDVDTIEVRQRIDDAQQALEE